MKIALCQPDYPDSYEKTLTVMKDMARYIKDCEPGTDLVILPEYSNCPGMKIMDEMVIHCQKHTQTYVDSIVKAAKDRGVALAFNILQEEDGSWTNRSIFIDKNETQLCSYDKTHLAWPEISPMGLTPGEELKIFEFMGIRITFAVCFELYFPGLFETISMQRPDIIISPSYQRSEDSEVLLKQAMGRALDSGAWLIRSSYSMGQCSKSGGMSYIISPNGEIVFNAIQETGVFHTEFNPVQKRMRPLAHGLEKVSSREIIDKFRRPELYRYSGPATISASKGYPRVCAHRGASGLAPENTLPAFSVAKALGSDEIEFDIRLTKDNKMIVCHDQTLDRVSNGTGNVSDFTFKEIRSLNAGHYMGWTGILFPTPEEIFRLLAGQIFFNIHVYETGLDGFVIDELAELISKYDMTNLVYFAAQEEAMSHCLKKAPHIKRCMLECFDENRDIVDIAMEYDCHAVQHFYTVYSPEIANKAHKAGLINNLFYEDDPEKIAGRLSDGIDTILSNFPDKILPLVHLK